MRSHMPKLNDLAPIGITGLYFLHLELIFSPLPLPMMSVIMLGCALAFFLFTTLFPRYGSSILALLLLICFVWSIVAVPSLWHLLYNATLDTYRGYSTLHFFSFRVSWEPEVQRFLLSVLIAGLFLFLSALFDCLLRICRWPRAAAFLLTVLLVPCVLHHVPQPFTIFFLLAALLSLFLSGSTFVHPFRIGAFFTLFLLLVLTVSTLCFPKERVWEQNAYMRERSLPQLITQLQNFFRADDMDHIDLRNAGDRFYVGSIHLSIHAQPQTYYLRTYSGARYLENQWTLLPAERYESLDSDYRSILLQLPPYDDRLLDKRDDPTASYISIQIEDYRGSEQRIVPYYLNSIPDDPQPVYDSYLRKDDADSGYTYTLWDDDVYAGYVETAYTFPNAIHSYDRFVMDNYMQISEEQQQLFHDLQLTDPASFREEDATLQDVAAYVRRYLQTNATYTLTPGSLPDEADFLTYFLSESHQGYCVHYATAATLMMRYYGYPSRYVEGYRITAADFDGEQAYVRDHHAHAWVEVYDSLIGWVPLEFTESAPSQEPTPQEEIREDLPESPSQSEITVPSQQEPSQPNQPSPQPSASLNAGIRLAWLAPTALLLLIVLIEWLRHRRWIRRCQGNDPNAGALTCWHLLQQLNAYGISLQPQAEHIALQARFSKEGITQQQQEQMWKLLQQALQERRSLPLAKRIRLCLIDAIW